MRGPRRRVLWLALLLLALVGAGAGAAVGAATRPDPPIAGLRACGPPLGADWSCGTLRVPLDRSGRVGGTVPLAFAMWHRPGPPRPALVALAGGPGQAALPVAGRFQAVLRPALAGRDLLVFDQRGTGVSGPLRCPQIEASPQWPSAAVAACARQLGPGRAFYASRDTAGDVEALRRRLAIPRLSLFGVSYGTKTAVAYARLFPRRVERLVLDSVVVDDTDPFYRWSATAATRVLRNFCREGDCDGDRDPVSDLQAVLAPMRDGVRWVSPGPGRPRVPLTEAELLHALVEGPAQLRAALPSLLGQAADGRFGPLLAALPGVIVDARADPWAPSSSRTVYLATSCEDGDFPWRRHDPQAVREAKARRFVGGMDATFAPFDHYVAEQYGETRICAPWPEAHAQRRLPPLPDVPALLLSGGDDALTPLEGAQLVAGELPHGRLVVVPGVGHGVLESGAAAARAELARFFAG